jgi:hypothetical protein
MRRLSKSFSARAQRAGGRCRYFALFGLQTIGAVIILWNEVSHYRQAIPATPQARPETLIRSLSAIAMIQTGYWISYRAQPPPPQITNANRSRLIVHRARGLCIRLCCFGLCFCNPKPRVSSCGLPLHRDSCGSIFLVLLPTGNGAFGRCFPWVETSLGYCPVIVGIGPIARDYSMSRRRQGRYQASFFAGTAP